MPHAYHIQYFIRLSLELVFFVLINMHTLKSATAAIGYMFTDCKFLIERVSGEGYTESTNVCIGDQ